VGMEIEGTVKSILDYGVFVDLGGVDGLIRKPDLSWGRIKHPSDVVSVGEKITVSIKDIDRENNKISLSYKKASDNPWQIFMTKYNKEDVESVKIVSITSFGAFAQIIDGIDGLIHISQIANQRVNNVADILSVGDVVDAKIIDIDADQKRISLSIRALIEDSADEVEEDVEDEVKEEIEEKVEEVATEE
ncbi:MAG: S1 RNA-binding domain-containing protein, partial [Clostridiales bacterium]|nr:S1 RNA-binding domain-containing protein [Clostridiales bacterium]